MPRGAPPAIALLGQHLDTAEGCLSWIDDWAIATAMGSGAPDALAGRLREHVVEGCRRFDELRRRHAGERPKAVRELQGYVYDAWLRMAEIYDELGRAERAAALRDKAATLFRPLQRRVLGRGERLLRVHAGWRSARC
jgi:hypothetical protein